MTKNFPPLNGEEQLNTNTHGHTHAHRLDVAQRLSVGQIAEQDYGSNGCLSLKNSSNSCGYQLSTFSLPFLFFLKKKMMNVCVALWKTEE